MANELTSATGRRKTAVARVNLVEGTGKWTINNRPLEEYFPSEATRSYMSQPLVVTNSTERFDIHVSASGCGLYS